jgi:stage V sporulation protein B
MLTCLTVSGVPLILSRKTAEYNASGKKNRIPSIISSSMIAGIVSSLFVIGAVFVFRGNLCFLIKDDRAIPIFLFMLPALVSTSVYSVLRGWFWGEKDFKSFSLGEFIEEIFRIIFTVLLAGGIIAGLKREIGIAIAFTLSDLLIAIVMIWIFFKKGGRIARPAEFKGIMKSSTPVTVMRVVSGIVGSLTAIIIPARLVLYGMSVGEATAAFGQVIGLAFPLITIPMSLTGSIIIVLIPEVSGRNALGNVETVSGKISKTITLSVAITGFFLALYLALGREIGEIIYGDSVAGEYVCAGSFLMVPVVINQIASSILNSVANERKVFFNYCFGTVAMLALLFFLPKYIGVYSIIVAYAAEFMITLVLNTLALIKKKILKTDFIKKSIMCVILSFPAAYIAKSAFRLISLHAPLFVSTTIAALLAAAIYGVSVLASGVVSIDYLYMLRRSKNSSIS